MTQARQCLLCLRELPLFQGLGRSEFAHVCLRATKKQIAKGESLFHQGESAEAVYLIKRGKLKLVQLSPAGREIILDVVGTGEVLGETALFRKHDHAYGAIALEDTGVCCFSRTQFEAVIRENPGFAVLIISALGQKLYESMQRIGEAKGPSVREKLLRVLLHLAEQHGRRKQSATVIELAITQQELADMVGASRVRVANVLKELTDAGLVGRDSRYYALAVDACLEKYFS